MEKVCMCLVAVYYRVVDDVPLILAANREEEYARGGTPLDLRAGPIPFIAGLDPVAGGTWLGVNANKVVIAVTNRPKIKLPERPRSRGLLAKELLAAKSAREAAQIAARELGSNQYAGCNFLCGDLDSLWVVHGGDWLRLRSLAPGFHILTNGDVNDVSDDRIVFALTHLSKTSPRNQVEALASLRAIATHPPPICRHSETRGTVAGTLLALHERPKRGGLWHAPGAPDQTEYVDRTDLFWELEATLR